jgi:hypothetical protein
MSGCVCFLLKQWQPVPKPNKRLCPQQKTNKKQRGGIVYLSVNPPFPVGTVYVPSPNPFPTNQPTCLSYVIVYKHMSNMYERRLAISQALNGMLETFLHQTATAAVPLACIVYPKGLCYMYASSATHASNSTLTSWPKRASLVATAAFRA